MPVDVSSLQRMLMDRLQEQISSPLGQQPQADSQHVSQFQQELGADADMGVKNAGAVQPAEAGDGSNAVNLQAVHRQALTPGDKVLANMSSPSGIDARQVTPASNVTGEGLNGLVHTQMAMNDMTLNPSIGVDSLSSTSQGFESLLKSS